jgi:protein-tyrosine phosphatase
MNISFKPNSIALPEPNPFFPHNNKSNPGTPLQHPISNNNAQSVSFNTDMDLSLGSTSFNSTSSQSPRIRATNYPRTPFPSNVNPLDNPALMSSPLCSPHAGLPLTELSADRFTEFLSDPEQLIGTLILDVRPAIQFSRSHVRNSINVCIPTTLLRRSTFNVQKLSSSLTNEADKASLSNWKQQYRIVLVDASSTIMNDSTPLFYLSKKFMEQEAKVSLYWLNGKAYIKCFYSIFTNFICRWF